MAGKLERDAPCADSYYRTATFVGNMVATGPILGHKLPCGLEALHRTWAATLPRYREAALA